MNTHPLFLSCKPFTPGVHSCKWYQPKLDGHWTAIERLSFTEIRISTRLPTDITAKLEWHPIHTLAFRLPENTAVLGELWLPGSPSSEIKTAINAQDSRLRFTAFAASVGDNWGMPVPLAMAWIRGQGFTVPQADTCATYEEPPFGFGDLPPDVEGYVCKDGNLLGWRKWKPVKTIELVVKGRTPGEGKYAGLIGALICKTACGCEVARVSGMSDEMRKAITKRYETGQLIGAVVEVAYQEVGSRGRLRFPRFRCFRPDKKAVQCTLSQDPDLNVYWSL